MTGETKMEERVRLLEIDHNEVKTSLRLHVEECNKRGEFHTKLLFVLVAGVMAAIIAQVFHVQFPTPS